MADLSWFPILLFSIMTLVLLGFIQLVLINDKKQKEKKNLK